MLASMYDASLDQFYPHNWQQPSVWPFHYNNRLWNGDKNFIQIESEQKWIQDEEKYYYKEYDELATNYDGFGNIIKGGGKIILRGGTYRN